MNIILIRAEEFLSKPSLLKALFILGLAAVAILAIIIIPRPHSYEKITLVPGCKEFSIQVGNRDRLYGSFARCPNHSFAFRKQNIEWEGVSAGDLSEVLFQLSTHGRRVLPPDNINLRNNAGDRVFILSPKHDGDWNVISWQVAKQKGTGSLRQMDSHHAAIFFNTQEYKPGELAAAL